MHMNNSDKAVWKHKFVVYTRDLKDQTKLVKKILCIHTQITLD